MWVGAGGRGQGQLVCVLRAGGNKDTLHSDREESNIHIYNFFLCAFLHV